MRRAQSTSCVETPKAGGSRLIGPIATGEMEKDDSDPSAREREIPNLITPKIVIGLLVVLVAGLLGWL